MKITLPTVAFQAGLRPYSLVDFSFNRRALFLDLGRVYFDAYFGKRTIAFDFQAARRAHGLVGLGSLPGAGRRLPGLGPAAHRGDQLGELAEVAAEFLADYVFQPVTDLLVPVQRYGFRSTLKALVKEVTA